jgi:drug/metabolite transporter (DMT)-like permease
MSLILALIGYFLLAIVVIMDKYILTRSLPKPAVYTFYSTIFMLAALAAWPFGVQMLVGIDWAWAVVSGVSFGLALWAMFVGIKKGEASHIGPFVGVVVTLSSFVLASLFLGETLSYGQKVGVGILMIASGMLSYQKTGRAPVYSSFAWAAVAGVLFGVSHVTAKYIYDIYPFLTGFVWTRATTGLVGIALLTAPSVIMALQSHQRKVSKKKKHIALLVVIDKVLGVAAVVLIQYAIAIGSVTLVNALSGIQYAFLFILITILSRFFSQIFHEYTTRKEIVVQSMAILLVIVGSVLFAI